MTLDIALVSDQIAMGYLQPAFRERFPQARLHRIDTEVQDAELRALAGGDDNLYLYGLIGGYRVKSEILGDPVNSTYSPGRADPVRPTGILDSVQQQLGIPDGEFRFQWLRGTLN